MLNDVFALVWAGLALALLELAKVAVQGRSLFLSAAELGAYFLAAATALPALVLLLGWPLLVGTQADRRGLRVRIGSALLALPLGAWASWSLTEGRRVRESALRPLIIAAGAVLVALFVILTMRTATFVRARRTPQVGIAWSIGCGLFCVITLLLDSQVLPRSYPAFHLALFCVTLFVAALAPSAWLGSLATAPSSRTRRLMAALPFLAPLAVFALSGKPNASFAVSEAAPWSGKILAPALRWRGRGTVAKKSTPPTATQKAAPSAARGIDLRDRDVLLITVDALRADMLSAYGGKGVAPELDALAKEGAVFEHAYTPAPHTSYALASLLTAKFIKPVLELPGADRDQPTLPDLLRRYGYRTAAFYPPAIFFVDGSRFDPLRSRGFGFEYRKEMFASAAERVAQVNAYLAEVQPGHPLFVWVHFFEPHEPYEPPSDVVRENTARGRYEGEVRVCDAAIGALVRAFREKRPNATVILTADHGEEFGEHGGSYHGTTLYEEQVKVPLVWSSPGSVKPELIAAPVELTDIGTTLLSAAGVPREARMRGDDLGGALAGNPAAAPRLAFASVESRHMVSDGRLKAICSAEAHCQLFDLSSDPQELHNLAAERGPDVERLRSEIERFFASIPKAEALAVSEGVGFPEALARAKLGAPGAGPEVIPLLADTRAPVRAQAARVLGELDVKSALPMLDRLRQADPDAAVRAEAAIATLTLGEDTAAEDVVALLQKEGADNSGLVRRAALALTRVHRLQALPALSELALDTAAPESDRLRAVAALGDFGQPAAFTPLVQLLENVRLRPATATALGALGGKPAQNALAKRLANERYEPARRAEARALLRLGDARAPALIARYLGMETSIPEGVRMLMELGALTPASARGALLTDAGARQGSWSCDAEACRPGANAAVILPSRKRLTGAVRATWLVRAVGADAALSIDGTRLPLKAGEQQVSLTRAKASEATRFAISADGDVSLLAVAVVPGVPEIPPPPPEPWDAGVAEGTPAP